MRDAVAHARALWAACVAGALLYGCAGSQPPATISESGQAAPVVEDESPQESPAVTEERPRRVSDTEKLLHYHAQLRRLTGPELLREHESARQAYVQSRSGYARVRYAMVLALPGTPFHDDARALTLLEPLARTAGDELAGLSSLLTAQIQERRRLDGTAQALQQKLDALKSLERSLSNRGR